MKIRVFDLQFDPYDEPEETLNQLPIEMVFEINDKLYSKNNFKELIREMISERMRWCLENFKYEICN